MLEKIDIRSAFRLLPVHLAHRHLLGMRWRDQVYYCIPFGLQSALKLFNILADLLAWIAQNAGVSYLIHYLDDYLTMGPPASTVCQCNVNTFVSLCAELGVPLATDKLEGIVLDTNRMEIRLPSDKLARIQQLLKTWLPRKRHSPTCHKTVKPFSQECIQQQLSFVRCTLNKAFRSDLFWWHAFLQSWNGLSILRHPSISSHPEFYAQTDASGT